MLNVRIILLKYHSDVIIGLINILSNISNQINT